MEMGLAERHSGIVYVGALKQAIAAVSVGRKNIPKLQRLYENWQKLMLSKTRPFKIRLCTPSVGAMVVSQVRRSIARLCLSGESSDSGSLGKAPDTKCCVNAGNSVDEAYTGK